MKKFSSFYEIWVEPMNVILRLQKDNISIVLMALKCNEYKRIFVLKP